VNIATASLFVREVDGEAEHWIMGLEYVGMNVEKGVASGRGVGTKPGADEISSEEGEEQRYWDGRGGRGYMLIQPGGKGSSSPSVT
jgi:hypothetical protein